MPPSNLRSVVAQCFNRGGPRRNFSSSPGSSSVSNGTGEKIADILVRRLLPAAMGYGIAYHLFDGLEFEVEEMPLKNVREHKEDDGGLNDPRKEAMA